MQPQNWIEVCRSLSENVCKCNVSRAEFPMKGCTSFRPAGLAGGNENACEYKKNTQDTGVHIFRMWNGSSSYWTDSSVCSKKPFSTWWKHRILLSYLKHPSHTHNPNPRKLFFKMDGAKMSSVMCQSMSKISSPLPTSSKKINEWWHHQLKWLCELAINQCLICQQQEECLPEDMMMAWVSLYCSLSDICEPLALG